MTTSPTEPDSVRSIAIVGAGNMSEALARRAAKAGLTVRVSSSGRPRAHRSWVDELVSVVHAGTPTAAAEGADIVVLAVPFGSAHDVDAAVADGRILVDLTNYYPGMYAPQPLLDRGESTSSALLQRHFRGARVVKAFNTIAAQHIVNLARSADAGDRTAIPVAADRPEDLDAAVAFADLLGFDALRVGALSESWRFEPTSPAFVTPYLTSPGAPWGTDPGRPAPHDVLATYIAAGRR